MDMAGWAVVIAAGALLLNLLDKVLGGSWSLSGRIAKIENSVVGMQGEITKLVEAINKIADMRGDLRVLDTRLAAMETRTTAVEQDIRELRHGDGFVRGSRGIDREYP